MKKIIVLCSFVLAIAFAGNTVYAQKTETANNNKSKTESVTPANVTKASTPDGKSCCASSTKASAVSGQASSTAKAECSKDKTSMAAANGKACPAGENGACSGDKAKATSTADVKTKPATSKTDVKTAQKN